MRRDRSSTEAAAHPHADASIASRRRPVLRWLAALAVIAVTGTWWLRGRRPETPAGPVRIVPFTADGGFKLAPRLSPDGERVAYTWTGLDNRNADVYVKAIGRGTRPTCATEHQAPDWGPVCVARRQADRLRAYGSSTGATIYTAPLLGGQERRLIDIAGTVLLPTEGSLIPSRPGLRTGSGWLLPRCLVRTHPPASSGCRSRRWRRRRSPFHRPTRSATLTLFADGRQLAFVRVASRHWGLQDVWVQSVSGPPARQLTFAQDTFCSGLTWTADAAELVFSTEEQRVCLRRTHRSPASRRRGPDASRGRGRRCCLALRPGRPHGPRSALPRAVGHLEGSRVRVRRSPIESRRG